MVGLYPLIRPEDVSVSRAAVGDLLAARVPWLQLRGGTAREQLGAVEVLRGPAADAGTTLVINDRSDIAATAGVGVHVGQSDLPPAACRALLGPGRTIGFSTHDEDEVDRAGEDAAIDYVAFGPIFATGSKADARSAVGVERLRGVVATMRSRRPHLPVVAIGGIGVDRAAEVLGAGVDAVAAIGALRDSSGRLDRARIAEMIAACRVVA